MHILRVSFLQQVSCHVVCTIADITLRVHAKRNFDHFLPTSGFNRNARNRQSPCDFSMSPMSHWTTWTLPGEHQGLRPELWLQGLWCLHGGDRGGAVEGQPFGRALFGNWLVCCGLASLLQILLLWVILLKDSLSPFLPFLFAFILCPQSGMHMVPNVNPPVAGGPQDRVGPSGPLGTSRIFPGIQRAFGAKTVPWRSTFAQISLKRKLVLFGFHTEDYINMGSFPFRYVFRQFFAEIRSQPFNTRC